MADPFIAEIRMFPFNFAPTGWAWCNGQYIPVSQNTALFALLGSTYGGNGKSYFALPNLEGKAPMHPQLGADLYHELGETGGSETVTLIQSEIPAHNHGVKTAGAPAEISSPSGTSIGLSSGANVFAASGPLTAMHFQQLGPTGGTLPHNNMQPYLTCYFNIALQGIFPQRE